MNDPRPCGAPLIGALCFFAALIVVAWIPGEAHAGSTASCSAQRYDDGGVVRWVLDGDTLELSDGRRVRLLGVDTPELGRDDEPPEPFAEPARAFLESITAPGTRVRLRLDFVHRDRYGRLLAHVFLQSGVNVQAELLAAGLAMTLVVPPNVWNHHCYARLEQAARIDERGIWRLDRFRPVVAEGLDPDTRGFRILTGTVRRVGQGKKNFWLDLAPGVALRVPKEDLIYFEDIAVDALVGRRVEARGYLARRRGELRMTVRHPAALRIIH